MLRVQNVVFSMLNRDIYIYIYIYIYIHHYARKQQECPTFLLAKFHNRYCGLGRESHEQKSQ
jgi:hypothetical protein